MGKYTKEEYALAKKQKSELLKLILKKSGVAHRDIIDFAEQQFIKANLDLVTPAERVRFDKLVF